MLTAVIDMLFGSLPGAVETGLIAGALLPLLGMWVVLQRVVFLGVTLAQVAAAGVALGLVLGWPVLPLGIGLTLAVVASGFVGGDRGGRWTDSSLGALFCAASALSLLFISRSPAELDEVQHVLHGNLIFASESDAAFLGAALVVAVLLLVAFFKQLLLASFDLETASALGLRARGWMALLFGVLAVVLALSMRTTGSLLSFAMLVLPPLAALRLQLGLRASFVGASVLGLLGTAAGLALAFHADLHLESSITLCLFLLIPVCAGWARHPLIGVALAGALLFGGLQLEPIETEPHHHHATDDADQADRWHLDAHLSARAEGDALRVDWVLDVLRPALPGADPVSAPQADDDPFPASLWLVITGDGLFHEHELLHHADELPRGTSQHSGSFLVEGAPAQGHVDGQLWSASMLEGEPLAGDRANVAGCDL
ncbi:MAG: hypothetical protein DHS20C15_27960 [Planctomycetota bacterium]|nr:MAG: hypothetical protein DHS20C15_27960 [Planctomycetota bacterium]